MVFSPVLLPDEDDDTVDAGLFRQAFRRHAASVAVVTYLDGTGAPRGMTATSMCAVSASPPSLLVCIARSSRTHEDVMRAGTFAVDVLSVKQRAIAEHCAKPGAEKRLWRGWLAEDTPVGAMPRLSRAVAHLECSMESAHDAFTHTVVIGRIRSVWLNPKDPAPLLYHAANYGRLATPLEPSDRPLVLPGSILTVAEE